MIDSWPSNESRRDVVFFTLLAVLQVIGGLIGLWSLRLALPSGAVSGVDIPVAKAGAWALFVLLYSLSVAAGLLLLIHHRYGRMLSVVVQAFQLINLSTAGITYSFVVGAALLAELRWPGPETYVSWIGGSQFSLFVGGKNLPPSLGINALALVVLVLALPWRRGARAEVQP